MTRHFTYRLIRTVFVFLLLFLAFPTLGLAQTSGIVVQIKNNGTDNTQQTQFAYQINNTGTSAVSGLSVRVYFTLDGGNGASNYVLEKYYDQSGVATISGPTLASGSTYYFTVSYGTASLGAGASWQFQTSMHLVNWGNNFSGGNDHFHTGYAVGALPAANTNTNYLPAYVNGTLVWGTAPNGSVPTNTIPPTVHDPVVTPTRTRTSTPCPVSDPAPVMVEPVTSPTGASSQVVVVLFPAVSGTTLTINTVSGTFNGTVVGGLWNVNVQLLPNTTHNLTVTGTVPTQTIGGCTYPGYTATTTRDRNGTLLVIVQQSTLPTNTPTRVTASNTPTRTMTRTRTNTPGGPTATRTRTPTRTRTATRTNTPITPTVPPTIPPTIPPTVPPTVGPSATPVPGSSFTGNATWFTALGMPYGGCGITQTALDTQNFIALNVQNTPNDYSTFLPRPITAANASKIGIFNNGLNCGRWVRMTVGDFCTGINDGAPGQPFCRNGSWISDQFNGATLDFIVADSCQDGNAWCRDDAYHVDLAEASLSLFTKNGQPVGDMRPNNWNNRRMVWQFIPAPNYTGDIKIGFLQNAQVWWTPIGITNLANGIHGVDYMENGVWVKATMNADMGQTYLIRPTTTAGSNYEIRVYDVNDQLINNGRVYMFSFPTSCGGNCPSPWNPVTYTTR